MQADSGTAAAALNNAETLADSEVDREPAASARAAGDQARIVARRNRNLVFLELHDIWAFEAADRATFVHAVHGKFDLEVSLAALELSLGRGFMRVHRDWLVNFAQVKELERDERETRLYVGAHAAPASQGLCVPVARERSAFVRDMLLMNAAGIRHR